MIGYVFHWGLGVSVAITNGGLTGIILVSEGLINLFAVNSVYL